MATYVPLDGTENASTCGRRCVRHSRITVLVGEQEGKIQEDSAGFREPFFIPCDEYAKKPEEMS